MEASRDMHSLSLGWKKLTVTADRRSKDSFWKYLIGKRCFEKFKILDTVSGHVKGGTLTAILGASGAGKTTLLAALSKRLFKNVTGHVLVDDKLVTYDVIKNLSGFLPQFDVVVEELTVLEHLKFMANMKLSESNRITDLITEFNLEKCVDTRVQALSGGEKKKLSLAVELLTKPSILFCDEPTTGLDSSGALAVISLLRDLTCRGMTVICSIHQPSSAVFECFENIILLKRGRILYQGTRTSAPDYFASLGLHCPANYNAADFYIRQISITEQELPDVYNFNSFEMKELDVPEEVLLLNSQSPPEQLYFSNKSLELRKPSWFRQVFWLLNRSMISSSRNYSIVLLRTVMCVTTAILIALFYQNLGTDMIMDTQIQDIRGAFYMVASDIIFVGAYAVIDHFPQQLKLLRRELGLYSLSAYYVANIITLIPNSIFQPVLFLAITYGSVEFQPFVSTFIVMATVLCIATLCANAYGYMFSAILGKPSLVTEVTSFVDLTLLLLAGMFANLRSFPPFLQILKHVSMFYYANNAISMLHWSYVTEIVCVNNSTGICLKDGSEVLEEFGFTWVPVTNHTSGPFGIFRDISYQLGLIQYNIIGIVVLGICMHLFAFLGLRRQSKLESAL